MLSVCYCFGVILALSLARGNANGVFNLTETLNSIGARSSDITSRIADFYNYTYDDPTQRSIINGGSNMFNNGNKIRISANKSATDVVYGRTYRFDLSVFSSIATHPFVALWWIQKSYNSKYVIEVLSGHDTEGSAVTAKSFSMRGEVLSIVGTQQFGVQGKPTVCEVFFVVNTADSNNLGANLILREDTTSFKGASSRQGVLSGEMLSYVVFGYTLLSTRTSQRLNTSEILAAVETIVENILPKASVSTAAASAQVTTTTTSTPALTTEQTTATELDTASQSSTFTPSATSASTLHSSTSASPPIITMLPNQNTSLLDQLRVTENIRNYYRYRYDASNNYSISDGGGDMYDVGNRVYFTVNKQRVLAQYNATYRGADFVFQSFAVQPFFAYFNITQSTNANNYSIQVISNLGADGVGLFGSISGEIAGVGGHRLTYHAAQVYSATDPSICEVYFHIYQNETGDLRFTTPQRQTSEMSNYVNLTGNVGDAILGYTLLSKRNGIRLFGEEIRNTMKDFLFLMTSDTGLPADHISNMTRTLQERLTSANITAHISDYYQYRYDDNAAPINAILDGGQDMYDTGNQVFYIVDGVESSAEYNVTYRSAGYSFTTLALQPFVAFFYINPTTPKGETYSIQVNSNLGADGSGEIEDFSGSVPPSVLNETYYFSNNSDYLDYIGNVASGNSELDYGSVVEARHVLKFKGVQVFGANDASICEVFFYVSLGERDDLTFNFSSSIRNLQNLRSKATLSGRIEDAVFGYTLLSTQTPGRKITLSELEAAMLKMLAAVTGADGRLVGTTTSAQTSFSTTSASLPPSTPQTSTALPAYTTDATASAQSIANIFSMEFEKASILANIKNYNRYRYDAFNNHSIRDGGADMYDGGNMVYFTVNNQRVLAQYNQTYRGASFEFHALAIQPFLAYFNISGSTTANNYSIQVISDLGADGRGRFRSTEGVINGLGGYYLSYHAAQVYSAGDPSICEVYFYIYQNQSGLLNFTSPQQDRLSMSNYINLTESENAILGYTLLSKTDGARLSDGEIQLIMKSFFAFMTPDTPEITQMDRNRNMTRAINSRLLSANVTRNIINYHQYRYDDFVQMNYIADGGQDMYDDGNRVSYYVNDVAHRATYNETVTYADYAFSTLAAHPFVSYFYINPETPKDAFYSIKVESNLGADGSGNIANFAGSVALSDHVLTFRGVQVYGANDASVCEVFFYISQERNNNLTFTFASPVRDLEQLRSNATLSGRIKDVVFGYTLLSTREPGRRITDSELDATMLEMLSVITNIDKVTTSSVTTTTSAHHDSTTPETSTSIYTTTASTSSQYTSTSGTSETIINYPNPYPSVLERINVLGNIGQYHRYRYDASNNHSISDGGNDMYDGGNMVYFAVNNQRVLAQYNQTYSGSRFVFQSFAIQPFLAYFNITEGTTPNNYSIQVISNLGSDGSGRFSTSSGQTTSAGGYYMSYHVAQVYSAYDPSVCEVYFLISQNQSGNLNFSAPQQDRYIMRNYVNLTESSGNAILGYTLLSKRSGSALTEMEIRKTMENILTLLTSDNIDDHIDNRTMLIKDRLLSANVTENINDYNRYRYDDSSPPINEIEDGGDDMYDNGNQVFYTVNGAQNRANYNETVRFGDFSFSTLAIQPFVSFFYINPIATKSSTYAIRVLSNLGADGTGVIEDFSGSVTLSGHVLNFKGVQVYSTTDPSVCEVFFYISKDQGNVTFTFSSPVRNLERLQSEATLRGRIVDVVFGYTLLSTQDPGRRITLSELEATMLQMLAAITNKEIPQTTVTTTTTSETTVAHTIATTATRSEVFNTTIAQTMSIPTATNHTIQTSPQTSPQTSVMPTIASSISPTETTTNDVPLLPTCSARGAVSSVFRCEAIFRKPARRYTGPQVCRSALSSLFRCVALQLYQCRMGAGENVLDSLGLGAIRSETMIYFLRDLQTRRAPDINTFLNTFCYHAAMDRSYPFPLGTVLGGICEEGLINELVDEVGDFMYAYLWSRTSNQVCPAFKKLKTWFVNATRSRCTFEIQRSGIKESTRVYLKELASVVISAVENMNSTICSYRSAQSSLIVEDFERIIFGQTSRTTSGSSHNVYPERESTPGIPMLSRGD